MENVAMTVTDKMLCAAFFAAGRVESIDDLGKVMRAALEAADAVRPVPALPSLRDISTEVRLLLDRGLARHELHDPIVDYVLGLLRQHAPSAPPVPDTRPLQVTADEWHAACARTSDLAAVNRVLARRPQGDAQVIWLHQTIADLRAEIEDLQRKLREAFDGEVEHGHAMRNALAVEREHSATMARHIDKLDQEVERWRERAESAESKLLRADILEHCGVCISNALATTQSPIADTADKSPSADNVFGDAGNDFFAQQHMLSQPAAPAVERPVADVARDLLECASNWEPGARLLGNITAHDIKRLAQVTPGALAKIEARLDRHEKALRKIASATMWATNDGNAVRALLDAKGGEHG
jgi:hypothetical protein